MKPTQLPDAQTELIRWWRSPLGLRYAENFMDRDPLKSTVSAATQITRLDPGQAFTKGWDGQYLAEAESHKLDRADSYWVSRDMTSLVQHAAKSMPGQPLHETDIPSRTGFVWFDKEIAYPDIHGQLVGVRAALWAPATLMMDHLNGESTGGVVVSFYSDTREPGEDYMLAKTPPEERKDMPHLLLLSVTPWAFDYPYRTAETNEGDNPYAFIHESMDSFRRFMASFWTLVQQPLATTTRHRPDRAAMRRAQRGGFLGAQEDIKVVTLRKIKNKSADDAEFEPESVNWTHRWMVDGHWRNQWVPSLNMHRLTYIAPYVKGPEDRPLILKDKVYKFAR